MLLVCFSISHGVVTFVPYAYAEEGGEKEKVDPNAPHPDFEYLQLDPLNLPIITTNGLTQQVSLLVSLEVDFGKKDDIGVYKPRLADAYIQDLYGALGSGFALMQGNIVDVRQIKQRLTSVTDKVLGPDHKVHDVLLQVVQQRPM
jgi:hypothetical protein